MEDGSARSVAVVRFSTAHELQQTAGWQSAVASVANALRAVLRSEDQMRVGESRVVVVLSAIGSLAEAGRVVERLASAVRNGVEGCGLFQEANIGVAWDAGEFSLEVLERRAAAEPGSESGATSMISGAATEGVVIVKVDWEPTPSFGRAARQPSALVGRAVEREVLRKALADALAGVPRLVAVEGEAGIGKSTLLRTVAAGAEQSTVLWAVGDPEETQLAFGVLGQLAIGSKGGLADLAGGLEPTADPLLVGAGLLGALTGLQRPVVVIVDDAHLADRESMSALRFALRRLTNDRVMAVVSFRPEGRAGLGVGWEALLSHPTSTLVHLGGLEPPEMIDLAVELGAGALSPSGAGRLWAHTGGHPLYARMLLEQLPVGSFERVGTILPAPVSLAATVVARLADCPGATRLLVEAAAVIGERSDVTSLAAVAGLDGPDRLSEPLREAVVAGLLVEIGGLDGEQVGFTHALVRAAVYHDLSARRRRLLHARAGQVVAGRAGLSHRVAASAGPNESLAAELEMMAYSDAQQGHMALASVELGRALEMTPPGPLRAGRLLNAIEARVVAGDTTGAAEWQAELVGLAPNPWIDYVAGFLDLGEGRLDESRTRLLQAWSDLAVGLVPMGAPVDLAARVAAVLGLIDMIGLNDTGMVRWGEEAEAFEVSPGWVSDLAWIARWLGLGLAGRTVEALANLDRRGGLVRTRGLDVLVARGLLCLWADDLEGARAELTVAVERATRGEPLLRSSVALGGLAFALYGLGRLEEATSYAELAVATADEAGRRWGSVLLHTWACYPMAAQGAWDDAQFHAEQAASWAALSGNRKASVFPAGARAIIADALGDVDAFLAAAVDIEASTSMSESGSHPFGPVLADALIRVRRLDEAQVALANFEVQCASRPRPSFAVSVARVHGQLAAAQGDWKSAVEYFARALEFAEKLRTPLEAAKVHLAAGIAGAAAHGRSAAHHLYSALDAFDALGASGYSQQTERVIEATGLALRHHTRGAGGLTPTEMAVARLVAERLSNREVASRLFVSVRAVEYHLTNIYAKLGVGSRRDLVGLYPSSHTAGGSAGANRLS